MVFLLKQFYCNWSFHHDRGHFRGAEFTIEDLVGKSLAFVARSSQLMIDDGDFDAVGVSFFKVYKFGDMDFLFNVHS